MLAAVSAVGNCIMHKAITTAPRQRIIDEMYNDTFFNLI
jgi:hypothetical protein